MSILASFLLPALAQAKARASGAVCLSNLKQLQTCWHMYVDDFDGRVPPNTSERTNRAWRSTPDSWIGSSSALLDTDFHPIEAGLLFKYSYNRSVQIYHCPADKSHSRTIAGKQLSMLRTRSYSMSGCWGGRTNEVQSTVQRLTEASNPGKLFVLIDENEDTIDDAHFLTWPNPDDRWVNMPSDRHGKSGTLSFADGHAETWKWKWVKRFKEKQNYWKKTESPSDLADLRRLQDAIIEVNDFKPQE